MKKELYDLYVREVAKIVRQYPGSKDFSKKESEQIRNRAIKRAQEALNENL